MSNPMPLTVTLITRSHQRRSELPSHSTTTLKPVEAKLGPTVSIKLNCPGYYYPVISYERVFYLPLHASSRRASAMLRPGKISASVATWPFGPEPEDSPSILPHLPSYLVLSKSSDLIFKTPGSVHCSDFLHSDCASWWGSPSPLVWIIITPTPTTWPPAAVPAPPATVRYTPALWPLKHVNHIPSCLA